MVMLHKFHNSRYYTAITAADYQSVYLYPSSYS
nr:MAG TPA: hypothetical protein [Caudoviricetes sp.]